MPAESFSPEIGRILAGALSERTGYSTFRSAGTTDWLLIHTVSGSGRVSAGGRDVSLREGDTVLYEPGTGHDYGTEGPASSWELLFAHFHPRPDWLPLMRWPAIAPGIGRLRTAGDVEQLVRGHLTDCATLSQGGLRPRELFAWNAIEAALLWCDTQNELRRPIDERVLRALNAVDRDPRRPWSMDNLARIANLSPSRFAHLFRDQMTMTPQQYVEQRRMTAAVQLLDLTNRTISSIASDVGYDNALYFSSRF